MDDADPELGENLRRVGHNVRRSAAGIKKKACFEPAGDQPALDMPKIIRYMLDNLYPHGIAGLNYLKLS